ncbi:MAG: hypothetical protein IKS54_01665 [Erysipelotrichaceae bacterium]|nr:hypothetical protein [Erysipelotrichaceae bacterium]
MMKRKGFLIFAIVLTVLLGCFGYYYFSRPRGLDNYPYEPDTPQPDPHNGTFYSDDGIMVFNGDGESIVLSVDPRLAALTGLPEGEHEGTYVFLSGDLPPHGSMPIRYDVAHELMITINDESYVLDVGREAEDGKTGTVGVGIVREDFIPILIHRDGFFLEVDFVKQ